MNTRRKSIIIILLLLAEVNQQQQKVALACLFVHPIYYVGVPMRVGDCVYKEEKEEKGTFMASGCTRESNRSWNQ